MANYVEGIILLGTFSKEHMKDKIKDRVSLLVNINKTKTYGATISHKHYSNIKVSLNFVIRTINKKMVSILTRILMVPALLAGSLTSLFVPPGLLRKLP